MSRLPWERETKPGADFERMLIYDRIVVRRDHAQQESDTNTNEITLVLSACRPRAGVGTGTLNRFPVALPPPGGGGMSGLATAAKALNRHA